jgi:hypothetical protein
MNSSRKVLVITAWIAVGVIFSVALALALVFLLPGEKKETVSEREVEEYLEGAGLDVLKVESEDDRILVSFEQEDYDSYDLMAAFLSYFTFTHDAAPQVERVTLVCESQGIPLVEVTALNGDIAAWEENDLDTLELMQSWEWDPPEWALRFEEPAEL